MRIICTVTNDLTQDQRMDRICTSLTGAGHEVVLVGRLRKDSRPLPARPYQQHRIPCKYEAGKAFYLEYNYRLVRELRSWSYEAICSVDVDTLAAGAALTRSHQKLVFDAHEWFHMTPEVVGRPLIRGFWKGLAKLLVPKSDLRYTVAPMLAGKLEEDYGMPFATVRNLPVRNTAPIPPPPDKQVILYQGMLNPGRGIDVAIKAMDALPACELWIAGSGPEEDSLRALAAASARPEKIRFLGFVAPDELPALTARAWLGINLLADSSPSYFYSLANKALDYVQAGVPSVQMRFPEYVALQERYGCYVLLDKLEPGALAAGVKRLIQIPGEYDGLRAACQVAARELCWEEEEKVLLDLWRRKVEDF